MIDDKDHGSITERLQEMAAHRAPHIIAARGSRATGPAFLLPFRRPQQAMLMKTQRERKRPAAANEPDAD